MDCPHNTNDREPARVGRRKFTFITLVPAALALIDVWICVHA